jgi:hypothetical protein
MSEVVAKYMGGNIKIYSCGENEVYFVTPPNNGLFHQFEISKLKYHSSWCWIHEVWEKLRNECTHTQRLDIKETLSYGTKEQAFEALFNAINFIQDAKNI